MLRFISESGPYIFPLMLITVVIIILTIRRGIEVFSRNNGRSPDSRTGKPLEAIRGIHAILFWGGFSALLGLLGQFTGMYKSLSVIVTAPV
nr:hypothetical protein [bacterium]